MRPQATVRPLGRRSAVRPDGPDRPVERRCLLRVCTLCAVWCVFPEGEERGDALPWETQVRRAGVTCAGDRSKKSRTRSYC